MSYYRTNCNERKLVMSYVIRIFEAEKLVDIDLEDKKIFTVGSSKKDDYIVESSEVKAHHIIFQLKHNVWQIKCIDKIFLGGEEIHNKKINDGDAYVLNIKSRIGFIIFDTQYSETRKLILKQYNGVNIGQNESNVVQLLNRRVSREHAVIYKEEEKYFIKDLNSKNGTYVNNKKIRTVVLKNNDCISIDRYDFIFNNGVLAIKNIVNDINLKYPTSVEIKEEEYPFFKRSPRLKAEVPTGEIEIQTPPNIGAKPEINWLTVLLPSLATVAIMAAVVFLQMEV